MWREASDATGGEEEADDGPDRSDGEAGAEGADHPLAVEGDLSAANVPEGFSYSEEKECGKECCSGRLVDAANCRHANAHDQCRDSNNRSTNEENAPVDAVELGIARA